jgi:hypothetical protein
MMKRCVVFREQPLVGRNTKNGAASGSQHPSDLDDGRRVILDVLQHVGGHDHIEDPPAKRKLSSAAAAVLAGTSLARELDRGCVGLYPDHGA